MAQLRERWTDIAEGVQVKGLCGVGAVPGLLVVRTEADVADFDAWCEHLQESVGETAHKIPVVLLPREDQLDFVSFEDLGWLDALAERVHRQWRHAQEVPPGTVLYEYAPLGAEIKAERRDWVRWTLTALAQEISHDPE